MSLIEDFLELELPKADNSKVFNAKTSNEFSFAKIGVNYSGFPVILISSKFDSTYLSQKNVKLKYIELTHNLECKVSENGDNKVDIFSLIIFKSNQKYLHKYFFEIALSLLKSLSNSPSQKEVFETFKSFVEIFKALSDIPTNAVQGLWAELFLIEQAKNSQILVNYWHNLPDEKFDFNADKEKIEIKSNSNLERVHIFSAEQLNPNKDSQVVVGSIFTKQVSNGLTVLDLLDRILAKVSDSELQDKLYRTIAKTLGNTFEQTTKIKFDYDLAKNSLRFYRHQDISKVERINIPDRVSEVKFKSNLTDIMPIDINKLNSTGQLFVHT